MDRVHQQTPQPLAIERAAEDLYNISGSGGIAAAYVTAEDVVLVDDKFSQNLQEIVAKVKSVTNNPIRYILNTHYYGDHAAGKARDHTTGDVVVSFPAAKAVHTGDLFALGSPFIVYSADDNGVEWTQTLDEVLNGDFNTIFPGHAAVSGRDDVAAFRNSFETMRNRISEFNRFGKTREESPKLMNIEDLGWKPSLLFERSLPGLYDEVG